MGCCQPKLVTSEHYEVEIVPPSENGAISSELLEMIKNDPDMLFRKTDVKACFQLPTHSDQTEKENSA